MKKLISVLLIISALSLFFIPNAFAEPESPKSTITVFISEPCFNERLSDDVYIYYTFTDKTTSEKHDGIIGTYSYSWAHNGEICEDGGIALDENGIYTFEISFDYAGLGDFSFSKDTEILINSTAEGVKADFQQQGKITIKKDFRCAKSTDAINISLGSSKPFERVYDGEESELFVFIANRDSNAEYTFEWFYNGMPIEDAKSDSIYVKNCVDSGIYKCSVTRKTGEETVKATDQKNIIIQKCPIVIDILDAVKKTGEGDPEFEFTVTGLCGGDTFSGTPTRETGEEAGNYIIKRGSVQIVTENESNYDISVNEGILTVKSASASYGDISSVVSDISDVKGANDSKIILEADMAAIPENAIFRIENMSDGERNEIIYHCEKTAYKNYIKGFRLSYLAQNGKISEIKNGTTVTINIPLTDAEKALGSDAFFVAKYDTEKKTLSTQKFTLTEKDGISYITLEVPKTGIFFVTANAVPVEPDVHANEDDNSDSLWWLWTLIIAVVIIAVVVILVCVFMIKPLKKELAGSSIDKAFEDKKKTDEIKGIENDTRTLKKLSEEEKPAEKSEQKVIYFDDLEDK